MTLTTKVPNNAFDFIIVGAGISGINAAYRLQTEIPDASYTILETRSSIGGTWDFFTYPGIRSDSDLYTFGFQWRPWIEQKNIADGASIRKYILESAAIHGIDQKVQFHHQLLSANWSSDQHAWTFLVDASGTKTYFHARFVILSTGYYDYNEALPTTIPGLQDFKGPVIHPQSWPSSLDYANKKVAIIGSGATAVTLLPVLAQTAAHVTMVQRSPTYIVARPATDPLSARIRALFPISLAHRLIRLQFLLLPTLFNAFCKHFPNAARNMIRKETLARLPPHIPHDPHFQPRYNPWEQRLCLVPDGDFFAALHAHKADIVTGTIDAVTATGIRMQSGAFVPADILITATGLKILIAGGATLTLDDQPVDLAAQFLWKGQLLSNVPNLATVIGYTNASWTLGADATALTVCRLWKHMRRHGFGVVVPRVEGAMEARPAMDLSSTYLERARGEMPKAGSRGPWVARKSYLWDWWQAKVGGWGGLRFE